MRETIQESQLDIQPKGIGDSKAPRVLTRITPESQLDIQPKGIGDLEDTARH